MSFVAIRNDCFSPSLAGFALSTRTHNNGPVLHRNSLEESAFGMSDLWH